MKHIVIYLLIVITAVFGIYKFVYSEMRTMTYEDPVAWEGATLQNSCTLFTKPMQMGDESKDVQTLQAFLIIEGMDIPAGPTGYYGTQTKAAVAAFQLKYAYQILMPLGLWTPTGVAWYATLDQMNAIYCYSR